jgi:hypothetical protein
MSTRRKFSSRGAAGADIVIPTGERGRHIAVEPVIHAIVDEQGRPSPYRCIDILAAMERCHSITAEMRQASEDFSVDNTPGRLS